MHKVLIDKPGEKVLLLSNEAIVRGALESGVGLAATYPGTPSSEIGDTYMQIAKDAGIYFEYSTNEKVALEVAAGAALSGVRSMTFFKHFGLNVALDSLLPVAYAGVKAGMVIIVADDPQGWSSGQAEEDSRIIAKVAHLPLLEPSNAQECKDFVKYAFELSEKMKIPVMIRTTTRVAHMRSMVELGKLVKGKTKGKFIKDIQLRNFPPYVIEVHGEMHKKIEEIQKMPESSNLNVLSEGKGKLGIIVFGASYNYVFDAMKDLKLKLPVFKIGMTYPTPDEQLKSFIKGLKTVLVVEELEPIIEERIEILAREANPKLTIYGKSHLPNTGELNEKILIEALSKITGKKYSVDIEAHHKMYESLNVPKRLPVLCAGCPHRATFYATKMATKGMDVVFAGDIGCYILGVVKPVQLIDFIFDMGAAQGVAHGIKKTTDQKTIAFLGDSTFFHSGIPPLINAVYNKSNQLVIILDNRITAMTGHQPNPGMGLTAMGESTKAIDIEGIVRSLGVESVKVVDPFNLSEMISTIKEFLNADKLSVIIAKRECQLVAARRKKEQGIKSSLKFEIDQEKCEKIGNCLNNLSCPAMYKENGQYKIDRSICVGCALCTQICPAKAIKPAVDKK
ncbi:MAG: indolepyruvate ferredoxin oxidoreductase subunit alpha [Candidatus Aenigmatarchaeota archaeon]